MIFMEMRIKNSIKAAVVQFNHRAGDKDYNLSVIEKMCREAASAGCNIIVFPEMCITGYWHVRKLSKQQISELSEPVPTGSSVIKLQKLASEHGLIIGAGLIEKNAGCFYNSYVVVQPDRDVSVHRKLHCFISAYLKSGNEFTVIETSIGVKLGVLICWDNNLIENARITALMGADILLAPHQTGGCGSSSPNAMGAIDPDLWECRKENPELLYNEFQGPKGRGWLRRWIHSRAHDNGMFLLFSNGVGRDDDEVRTGNAMIIDCYGEVVNESISIDDDMVTGILDLSLLDKCSGRKWIKARRPELYGALLGSNRNYISTRALRFGVPSADNME